MMISDEEIIKRMPKILVGTGRVSRQEFHRLGFEEGVRWFRDTQLEPLLLETADIAKEVTWLETWNNPKYLYKYSTAVDCLTELKRRHSIEETDK